jgi:hypothetical protein
MQFKVVKKLEELSEGTLDLLTDARVKWQFSGQFLPVGRAYLVGSKYLCKETRMSCRPARVARI